MAILELENVHAGYGDALVLKGVDISVDDGRIVCLIGPNGAGKSTVFRCVFGLIRPSEGEIRYRGADITSASQRELLDQGMGYILQRDSVFQKMTVRDNLELGAYSAPRGFDVDRRIREMYELFPVLEDRADTDAGALSGGERQMLEFARGMMLDPDLLLIDEPTAGLAPKIIDDIFETIQRINESGVTVFMIEQNVNTALDYADEAYVLENGRTRFHDDAETILDQPEIRDAYLGGS